ncbi:MAG: holo-ACP synthase [Planctomycetes bacterium]|nr:holo-ACP synthase [Planctomycetota bacterium]
MLKTGGGSNCASRRFSIDSTHTRYQCVRSKQTAGPTVHRRKSNTVIVGLGTDIIEIVRIGRMVERHGELFLHRVFTEGEIRYCQRRKESFQHFAGRWAAKEAVMKALGTGWIRGVGWQDIEVDVLKSGKPVIHIHGSARDFVSRLEIDDVLITISHCRSYATATAIAVKN